MVQAQHSSRRPVRPRREGPAALGASTPYHFRGKIDSLRRLAARRHPLEKLGFQAAGRNHHDQTDHPSHEPLPVRWPSCSASMSALRGQPTPLHRSRPHPDRHLASDTSGSPHCGASSLDVAKQILSIHGQLRESLGCGPGEVGTVTLDTDTTVHTLYGRQMGGRKSYNPKNKGKRSLSILTFLAETREYLSCAATGRKIAAHLESAFRALPGGVKRILARADAGFYCWEAVAAYQQRIVSSYRLARPGGWSSSCSNRPTPTRRLNANSSTSRKAGRRPAVSWRCVTKRSPRPARPTIPVVCNQRTACLSPTWPNRSPVVWFYNQPPQPRT